MKHGLLWRIPILLVGIVAWGAPAQASDRITVTGADDVYIVVTEPSNVDIRTYAWQYGIDSQLWLYDDTDTLIASNDDWYGLDSRILIELQPGEYRLRTGVCCGDPDWWYGQSYELEGNMTLIEGTTTTWPAETTSTTSSTTSSSSLPPPSTTTTTTTAPPATTTTLPPTTTAPTADSSEPTSSTPETSTTLAPSPTNPSTSTPNVTSVTPSTTVTPTVTAPPARATTSLASPPPPPTSAPAVPVATSTPTTSTPTAPDADTQPSTTSLEPASTEPSQPPNGASDEQKKAFEEAVNVFDGTHDDYVPAGSTVTVAERRTIIAATTATAFALPTPTNRRRRK